jgi:hypothetical protein
MAYILAAPTEKINGRQMCVGIAWKYMSMYVSISLYSCCFHLEHRASVRRFVSLQFLNIRQSVRLLRWGISPSQGRYLHRTTQTQTNIHALSGIRTHGAGVRASEASSCLRPRGHCDRLGCLYYSISMDPLRKK